MSRTIATVGVAVLLVVAGCSGPGDRTPEPIEAEATQATVSDAALTAAGFEGGDPEPGRVNASGTLDVSGDVELTVEYRIRAATWRAVYRTTDADPPTVFAAYSVPLAEPESVDATIDPLRDRSPGEIASLAQDAYTSFGELHSRDSRSATMLGTDTEVEVYETTANNGDTAVDVVLYVAAVEHDGDVVRAVAVLAGDADWETVRSLIVAVEH